MPNVTVYIDDIIILSDGTFQHHMEIVSEVLHHLEEKGLQVNPAKSFWAKDEVEYLGFVIKRQGIKPQAKNIQAILDIKTPTTCKQVRSFVGMINYYRRLFKGRSKTLAPLTALTGKGTKF